MCDSLLIDLGLLQDKMYLDMMSAGLQQDDIRMTAGQDDRWLCALWTLLDTFGHHIYWSFSSCINKGSNGTKWSLNWARIWITTEVFLISKMLNIVSTARLPVSPALSRVGVNCTGGALCHQRMWLWELGHSTIELPVTDLMFYFVLSKSCN